MFAKGDYFLKRTMSSRQTEEQEYEVSLSLSVPVSLALCKRKFEEEQYMKYNINKIKEYRIL